MPERSLAESAPSARWNTSGALGRLLAERARVAPHAPAFRDGPGRQSWSGRPSFEMSCAVAAEAVARLAAYLVTLSLEPAACVGICLPNGSEAALTILAVGEAGLTPCLLDATATAGELSNALEAADVRALVTQAQLGQDRLAQKLCFVAAGFFRLRFLLAFGPNVPDGVVDLDPVLREARRGDRRTRRLDDPAAPEPGIVTFARGSAGRVPVFRTYASLFAAAAPLVSAARIGPDDRVLTFAPPDDLKGLASGLVAALAASATLEAHGLFDSRNLSAALADPVATHLVLPGSLEAALAGSGLAGRLRSLTLLHEPPLRFVGRAEMAVRIVDAVACSEVALLIGARRRPDLISLDGLTPEHRQPTDLLAVEIAEDGEVFVRGPAAALANGESPDPAAWQSAFLRAEGDCGAPSGLVPV